MAPGTLRLSVVVCTRDRVESLSRCVDALKRIAMPADEFEIVVVDNGSSDGTKAAVRGHAAGPGPSVRLVEEPRVGLNWARNAGVRGAQAPVLAFIDDDETVAPDFGSRALAHLAAHPEIAGVGGRCEDPPEQRRRTCGQCSLGAVTPAIAADGRTSRRLLGGNMILRRDAFNRAGMFDTALSGRGDEAEWFARAVRAGLVFHYDAGLTVLHHREHLRSVELIRAQFRQGMALPQARSAMGSVYRPRPKRVVRPLLHAVRSRCLQGAVLASREAGASAAWARHRLRQVLERTALIRSDS